MLKNSDAFNSGILTVKVRRLDAQEPSWMLLESIWSFLGVPFRAQLESFFQVWFQGVSQGGFCRHFGVLLEVILDGLLMFSESILGVIVEPAV